MKPFLLFLFCACSLYVHAQSSKDTIDYLTDYKNEKCEPYQACYYHMAFKENDWWHVKDYYLSSQTIAVDGVYSDDSMKTKEGVFYWRYENGNIQKKGRYVHGKKMGLWREYYEDGKLADSSFYIEDIPATASFKWDKDGKIAHIGIYDKEGNGTGYLTQYHPDKSISAFGKYSEKYEKDSTWTYSYNNGVISYKEYFEKGNLLKEECFDDKGNAMLNCESEAMPQFPGGGEPAFRKFIQHTGQFPDDYKFMNGNECMVVARFVVGTDGGIDDVKLIKKVHPAFDREVIYTIKKSPKWKPASDHNRPVRVYYTIGFIFRDDRDKR